MLNLNELGNGRWQCNDLTPFGRAELKQGPEHLSAVSRRFFHELKQVLPPRRCSVLTLSMEAHIARRTYLVLIETPADLPVGQVPTFADGVNPSVRQRRGGVVLHTRTVARPALL
ncbi:hypothetical protein Misp03_16660 [Microbispora sp. NBRC 16548]|nr:hypothetical protein Misp03_16660 [Microbispora sp. NBRC 16548]